MSKRKILMLAVALCMVAILAVGGTLAYFTDDEQATNTFTIGNIEINIEETVKDENGNFVPFVDDNFTLYPISNETFLEGYPNSAYNKVVRTFNTSPSEDAAYIRTIILFEKNDLLPADYVNDGDCCPNGLHFHYLNDGTIGTDKDGFESQGSAVYFDKDLVVEIGEDKNEYYVVVFTEANGDYIEYNDALYTISGVWMDKNVTIEQAAGWGEKVDIIVYSQGIQATGLTHEEAMTELGEVTKDNVETWVDGDDAVINDWVNK